MLHYSSSYENEYFFHKLPYIFLLSNQYFDYPFDVYILSLSEKIPLELKIKFKKLKAKIIEDPIYDNGYYLRNFSIYYFWQKFQKKFLYLDIDTLIMKFDENFKKYFDNFDLTNSILVETVPDQIITKIENQYNIFKNIKLKNKLYYNWIQIIHKNNINLYDLQYSKLKYLKDTDIELSNKINSSNINKIEQNIGTYYPKHDKLNYFFHYDGLHDSGSFYRLKNYNVKLYNYIIKYLKKEPDFKGIQNDPRYYIRMGVNL